MTRISNILQLIQLNDFQSYAPNDTSGKTKTGPRLSQDLPVKTALPPINEPAKQHHHPIPCTCKPVEPGKSASTAFPCFADLEPQIREPELECPNPTQEIKAFGLSLWDFRLAGARPTAPQPHPPTNTYTLTYAYHILT